MQCRDDGQSRIRRVDLAVIDIARCLAQDVISGSAGRYDIARRRSQQRVGIEGVLKLEALKRHPRTANTHVSKPEHVLQARDDDNDATHTTYKP